MMDDVPAVFARAAKGDIDAQAAMLDHMVTFALTTPLLTTEYLQAVEMWARMLMTHGRPCDAHRLAGVLLFRSSVCRRTGIPEIGEMLAAEGMRILDSLTEEGDHIAAGKRALISELMARGQDVPPSFMLDDRRGASH